MNQGISKLINQAVRDNNAKIACELEVMLMRERCARIYFDNQESSPEQIHEAILTANLDVQYEGKK